MEDLKKIREKITEIDNQMAQLFEARNTKGKTDYRFMIRSVKMR